MKTAMQELIDELESIKGYKYGGLVIRLIKNKLEKEKEQIKTAFASGWNWNSDPEKYYQETYNQQEDKTFKQKSKWTEVDNMTRRLK